MTRVSWLDYLLFLAAVAAGIPLLARAVHMLAHLLETYR